MQEGSSAEFAFGLVIGLVLASFISTIVVSVWKEFHKDQIKNLRDDLDMAEYAAEVVAHLSRTSRPTCVSKPTMVRDLRSLPGSHFGFVDWSKCIWEDDNRILLPKPATGVMNRIYVVSDGVCLTATVPDDDEDTEPSSVNDV